MLDEKTWKPATTVKHLKQPRSCILRDQNGHMLKRNRKHIAKTGENRVSDVSDDESLQEEQNIPNNNIAPVTKKDSDVEVNKREVVTNTNDGSEHVEDGVRTR